MGYYDENTAMSPSARRGLDVKIYAGVQWIVLKKIDYVFKEFPEEIRVSTRSDNGGHPRTRVCVVRGATPEFLANLFSADDVTPGFPRGLLRRAIAALRARAPRAGRPGSAARGGPIPRRSPFAGRSCVAGRPSRPVALR